MIKKYKIENFPVVIYNLSDYSDILKPFCELLLKDDSKIFSLGADNENNKLNLWETNNVVVNTVKSIFDSILLEYADEVHPLFKGKGQNYFLERDCWLNLPTSWQGTRIHRHWEPFLKPKDIGDLITVFYIFGDELGNSNNGTIDFFEETNNHYEHLWLPENLKSKYSYKPKLYDLIIMTADTWHRARPLKGKRFNGKRFSLATDVKLIKENNV